MKIIKRITCDILELPQYLAVQSEQGLHITKLTGNRAFFKQGEKQSYDYNIIPVNNSDEFDRLYDIDGWKPILTYGEFVLLRAEKGTPFKILMDKNVTLVKLLFMRTMYLIRISLAAVGSLFSAIGIFQYASSNALLCALSAVMLALLVAFGIKETLPMIRVIKSIKKLAGKESN